MNWLNLESDSTLEDLLTSKETIAIFKHSTRCAISSMAKNRIEKSWQKDLPAIPIYYLDLIQFRGLSNLIEERLNVRHQSPQLIVLKNGEVVYNASHSSIASSEAAKHI